MRIVQMKQRLLDEPASKITRQTAVNKPQLLLMQTKKKHLHAGWSSALSSLPRLAPSLDVLPCY